MGPGFQAAADRKGRLAPPPNSALVLARDSSAAQVPDLSPWPETDLLLAPTHLLSAHLHTLFTVGSEEVSLFVFRLRRFSPRPLYCCNLKTLNYIGLRSANLIATDVVKPVFLGSWPLVLLVVCARAGCLAEWRYIYILSGGWLAGWLAAMAGWRWLAGCREGYQKARRRDCTAGKWPGTDLVDLFRRSTARECGNDCGLSATYIENRFSQLADIPVTTAEPTASRYWL